MTRLVDIHAHLLPGVDDGPDTLAESVEMAAAAAAAGTGVLAASPHLRSDFPNVRVEELASRCQEVAAVLYDQGVDLEVVSGAEVSLGWALDADDQALRLASYGQRGSDLLVETPSASVVGLDSLLFQLSARGYRITLAHPERSPDFQRDAETVHNLVRQGILLQINADSLLGGKGRSPRRRLARDLCVEGWAHVIASDGHRGAAWRPVTDLALAADSLVGLVGPNRAEWMMSAAPTALLAGEVLPEAPSIRPARRRRFRFS